MTKNIVCIVCPNGCRMTVTWEGDNIEVSGAKCPKGKEYAITEIKDPKRTVTTTVKTVFEDMRVLPVRTNGEIPKGKIFDLMEEINNIVIDKRVKRGEVILANVFNTGVDVIATSGMLQHKELL